MKNKNNSENGSVTILIAEDSATQAEQLKFLLEKHHYHVIVAKDGKEALGLVVEHIPSLVISDIIMPEMNGYELCKEIKSNETTMQIPVILLTSLARSEDVLEGISCGADNFITKPYREDYLISHIEQILANRKIYKNERVRVGVEILFGGKRRFITSSQQQMLSLLISTYEAAVQRNDELVQTQDELKKINDNLEEIVAERTSELLAEIEIRKRAEDRIIKLNRVYAVLSNINQAIVRIHDTKQLLNKACLIAIDEGKFQSAWIEIVNSETKKIETAATAGLANGLFEVSQKQNPIVNAIKSGKSFFSNNIDTDNEIAEIWKRHSSSLGFKSFVVFPLIVLGKSIGGYCICSNEVNFFDELEINLLDEMSTDISFALEYIQKEFERKRTEEALLKLKKAVDNSGEIIFLTDKEGLFTFVNPAFTSIYGFTADEIVGKVTPRILKSGLLKTNDYKLFWETLKGGKEKRGELINKRKDGTLINVEVSASPILDETKNIIGFLGIQRDITERKLAEEKILKIGQHYQTLIEKASDGIVLLDAEAKFKFVSNSAKKMFGYSISDEMTQDPAGLTHPDDLNMVLSNLVRLFEDPSYVPTLQYRFAHKNGNWIWVETTFSNFIADPNVEAIVLNFRDISERKRAEEAQRAASSYNRRLIESSIDPLVIIGQDGKITDVNEATEIVTGVSRELLIGDDVSNYFTESEKAKEGYEKVLADGLVRDYPLTFRHTSGKTTDVLYNATVYKNEKGEIQGIFAAARDITELERADEELKTSEKRYRDTLDNMLEGCMLIGFDWRYLYINESAAKHGHQKREDLIGKTMIEMYPGVEKSELFAGYKHCMEERISLQFESSFTFSDGKVNWFFLSVQPVPEGIFVLSLDISERKRAEEEIVMLAHSLKSINECVSITDMEDKILFVNESFLKTYGYSENELIGKNMTIARSPNNPPELTKEILPATISGGWKGELWNKRKDGSEFPISLSTKVINDKDGKPLGLIGVAHDITERKRAEKELIESKEKAESANKLKDAFINNMSHEIRTPLNGILGLSNLIKENYARYVEKEDESLFTGIDSSSQRIIRTVDMILNYSRLQTGEFSVILKEINLLEICEHIINQNKDAAEKKNLELIFDNQCGEAKIIGDEYSITQAISNLIDNAVKYTKKGFVKVSLFPKDNNRVLFEIKDTGIGIGDEYLEHLFEPYRQEEMGYGRSYEGVGLGLALTKKYFELNKAVLSVASKKGEGTTFTIEFSKGERPETDQVNMIGRRAATVSRTELKKDAVILIVEDDALNQDVLKRILDKKYKSLFAESAEEVYAVLKDNNVDLILMDISINGDKDGLELTHELKAIKEYSHIPVIAVTAHAYAEDWRNAIVAGCDDYIAKPYSFKQLFDKIAKYVSV